MKFPTRPQLPNRDRDAPFASASSVLGDMFVPSISLETNIPADCDPRNAPAMPLVPLSLEPWPSHRGIVQAACRMPP